MRVSWARHVETGSARVPRRAHVGVVSALLLVAALAWAVAVRRMSGMATGPGTEPGGLASFLPMWLVMMAAMMLPAIAPAIARTAVSGTGHSPDAMRSLGSAYALVRATTALVAAYLGVWGVVGLLTYGALRGGNVLVGTTLGWNHAGRGVVVAVLGVASCYQLTAAKRANLRRSSAALTAGPLLGWGATLQAGWRLGVACVACSGALVAALVALGAMNLTWMALFTVLLAAERLLPRAPTARLGVTAVLVALTIGVALAPTHLPGLTVPGRGPAMHMQPDGRAILEPPDQGS